MPALAPVVVEVECIVKGPFVRWWQHPIWWWKMRHLRRDVLLLEAEIDPRYSRRMRQLEDNAFLNGKGN